MKTIANKPKNRNSSSRHAHFGVSNFTYPTRNIAFLLLVGKNLAYQPEKIALLGSGPLEPFEVLDIDYFQNSVVYAFDSNAEVVEAVNKGLRECYLSLTDLKAICRSPDSENPYFTNKAFIKSQLRKAEIHNHCVFGRRRHDKNVEELIYYIGRDYRKKLKMRLYDLAQAPIPAEISMASLVFEGFMLINWEKSPTLFSRQSQFFLETLFRTMRPNAWFASTTSASHYLGDFSEPYMRQVANAGRIPTAGVLARWSIDEHGRVTSQFGCVFQSRDIEDEDILQLGNDFEFYSLRAISAFGLQVWSEEMSEETLIDSMKSGNVLSLVRIKSNLYHVNRVSWAKLSQCCRDLNKTYELEFYPDSHMKEIEERLSKRENRFEI